MMARRFKTYAGVLAFMQSQAAKGHVWHMLVLHGPECSASRCVCEPWYEVRPGTVENFLEGELLQRKWVKETSS